MSLDSAAGTLGLVYDDGTMDPEEHLKTQPSFAYNATDGAWHRVSLSLEGPFVSLLSAGAVVAKAKLTRSEEPMSNAGFLLLGSQVTGGDSFTVPPVLLTHK